MTEETANEIFHQWYNAKIDATAMRVVTEAVDKELQKATNAEMEKAKNYFALLHSENKTKEELKKRYDEYMESVEFRVARQRDLQEAEAKKTLADVKLKRLADKIYSILPSS